jgi:hypothetical protein
MVEWKAVSSTGLEKGGSIDPTSVAPDCRAPVFLAHTRNGLEEIDGEKTVSISVPTVRYKKDFAIPDCHFVIYLEEENGAPILTIQSEAKVDGQIEDLVGPRQHAWLLLYPVAVSLDVGGLALLAGLTAAVYAFIAWVGGTATR